MRKIWQTGLIAALLALLVPVVILTAAGAVRSAAPPEEPVEDCTGDTEEAETPEENASHDTADESDDGLSGWDARQPVALEDHGTLRQLTLADYLAGVLMGEMLPSFEDAALEAQAVAARTFTLRQLASGKHDGYLCAEAACCQAWLSPEEAQSRLGEAYEAWYARCRQAVAATDGLVLTYQDKLIEATYFSCSGGRTEAAVAVWGGEVPYLVAVDSPGEENAPRYHETKTWTAAAFRALVSAALPELSLSGPPEDWFGAVAYTDGGGVATMELGGQALTGASLRTLLGLNSTQFTVAVDGETIRIDTYGFGHRVGMSQYGANAMAREGADCAAILAHYYPGTTLAAADAKDSA